jgi:hypothetical protein
MAGKSGKFFGGLYFIFNFFLIASILLFSCSPVKRIPQISSINRLSFLGKYELPHGFMFEQTMVGGLSGIDYDAANDEFYLISDDRSAINPARFYKAAIGIGAGGINHVQWKSVTFLRNAKGSLYSSNKTDPSNSTDPESIRFDPVHNQVVWTSEGEKLKSPGGWILQDPGIIRSSIQGNYADSFILPPQLHMQPVEKGPRSNGTFEGLSFIDQFRELLVSLEEPLFEDGYRAGLGDSSTWVRFLRFDAKTGFVLGQYGYRLDPVAHAPKPEGAFRINGISEILYIGGDRLLVVERSFSTGNPGCSVKVYLANLSEAGDISRLPGLERSSFHPVKKELLLNMDDLGTHIDNVEGLSLGPRLPDGRQTLVFVTDNNFDEKQVTQFLLFAIE